ncbi:MAG: sterol desaturase family protein [Saprospiraceae bacterium]
MEVIIKYFETISSAHRAIILVGGLTFFWVLESIIPLFSFNYSKWKHAKVNIFFTITTIVINFTLAFILIATVDFVANNQWGLMHLLDIPLVMKVIVGLALFDFFGAYLPHYIEHQVKWLWMFHLVHHTDQNVDTTTANRHHPGESVLRFVFTTIAVLVLGAPIWLVFLYQSLSVVFTQFSHSNIVIPNWLDRLLLTVLVTPNMHRVHHHYRIPYTDSNYGNMFSIWDRIFGTYIVADNTKLKYGLDTYMDVKEAEDIGTILMLPFREYHPYIDYAEEEKL